MSDKMIEGWWKARKEKGSFIVIGIPLPISLKSDLRLNIWASAMCQRDNVIIKYEATRFFSEGANKIIHYVLKNIKPATHILLLNADEAPINNNVLDLMLALDKDIVVGVAPIIYEGVFWKTSHWTGNNDIVGLFEPIPYDDLPKEPFRAFDSAGPYLIKREVFEKMDWPWFFDIWNPETSERILAQDLYFSRKAGEYDFEIWCEPKAVFEHYKHIGLKHLTDIIKSPYGLVWGGWSIEKEDWEFIKDVIEKDNIKNVLEFGSGLSSLLMSELIKVDSFETDIQHARKIVNKIKNLKSLKNLRIDVWDGEHFDCNKKYDLVFVDGPPGGAFMLAGGEGRQYSIKAASKHSDRVIIHDAKREDELKWQEKYLKPKFDLVSFVNKCNYWKRKE